MEGGLNTLRKLIMTRPAHRMRFLDVLLEFTSSEKNEVSVNYKLSQGNLSNTVTLFSTMLLLDGK